MNETHQHLKALADAVAAVIVAAGNIWLSTRNIEPSKVSKDNDTPQPVVHETPAPAVEEKGRVSSRQMGMLRKLVNEKLDGDWNGFDETCKARFGRRVAYLSTKEASTLISEMIGGQNGHQSRSAR